MPRSSLTGTQKKGQKRDIKFSKTLQEKYLKDLAAKQPLQKETLSELRDILSGKHLPTTSLGDLMKDFQRAGKGAEEIFAPIKEQALEEFGTQTVPGIYGHFGLEMGARSSALNQALSAARSNLSRQLASDFSSLQSNLAQNLLNQRESNRLNALQSRLQTAGLGLGQPVNLLQTGLASQNPYLQKQGGPSSAATLLGAGIQAAGTIGGAYLGGPAGAAAGSAAASQLNRAFIPGMNQL
jgi:hypothetical protein